MNIPDRQLVHAAEEGETETMRSLIEMGTNVNSTDDDGWTPLHFAAVNGHTETAVLLIERKADADSKNNRGSTPLEITAALGYTETAAAMQWAQQKRQETAENTTQGEQLTKLLPRWADLFVPPTSEKTEMTVQRRAVHTLSEQMTNRSNIADHAIVERRQ